MAFDITEIGLQFIQDYGLIAIFILLVLDGSMLLPVFPGELVLIIAVSTFVHDTSSLIFMIGFTSAAGLVGSLMLYGVTRGGGRRLVERFPGFFMMPRKRRERLERVFANPFGQTLVLFLRLFPLTRVLVSIPAGLARMPLLRFIILSTIGLVGYHAAFLWFTFEARRPGSTIEAQKNQLTEAYASPAWDFVEANAILTGIVLVVIGAVISVRASVSMIRDPEESTGSLIGNIASAILLYGGVALAVTLYVNPEPLYGLMRLGGIDIDALTTATGLGRNTLLGIVAATSIVLGFIVRTLRTHARHRRKRYRRAKRIHARWERDNAIRAALVEDEPEMTPNYTDPDLVKRAGPDVERDPDVEWKRPDERLDNED